MFGWKDNEFERFNDTIKKVKVVVGNGVWEVTSSYCLQVGRPNVENNEFYELLDEVVTHEKLFVGNFQ